MEHKGYTARIECDDSIDAFHGRVLGIRDVVTFEGDSAKGLKKAFQDAIDDYSEQCKEEGVAPEKPSSGRFNLRLEPELHRQVSIAAEARGESLNSFVVDALRHALRQPGR